MGFIEETILKAEGLSDTDIATINQILPDVQALDLVLEKEWPTISRVVTALLPIFGKILQKQRGLT